MNLLSDRGQNHALYDLVKKSVLRLRVILGLTVILEKEVVAEVDEIEDVNLVSSPLCRRRLDGSRFDEPLSLK